MREVITLQVGTYANWMGAHFWNIQARPRTTATPALHRRERAAHDAG